MSIDGVGAFDHVSRARMFEQLMGNSGLHGLLPFVRQWYGIQSKFVWRDNTGRARTILQGDGGEQGDALMPALFCLALHAALGRIRDNLPPGAEIIAYLDDIYVLCDPNDTTPILHYVADELLRTCNIDVNMGKLAIWGTTPGPCPDTLAAEAPTAWRSDKPLEERGIKILGAPFGSLEYVERFGTKLTTERTKLLNYILKLSSLQVAWLLLYYCAVPRLNHILRTTPPNMTRALAESHDAAILSTFLNIFGVPTSTSWDC